MNLGVIEESTVYMREAVTRGDGGGSQQFFGLNKELVLKRANKLKESIDSLQSPNISEPTDRGDGYWHVTVNWWGLGG